MCQERGVENGSSCFGGWLQRWSGRVRMYSSTSGWMPAPAAHSSQSPCETRRWTWTIRFTSADDIGRTSALSCARLPAATITEPAGNVYSPTRRSWIRL